MIVLPSELRAALRANAVAHHDALQHGEADTDPAPILKLFNPLGAATWLATELYADEDTLFGLADLGFGCPELGVFSLTEIAEARLPFGLGIERDLGFATTRPLSAWADAARRAGSILCAETLIRRAAAQPDPELPTAFHQGGGG